MGEIVVPEGVELPNRRVVLPEGHRVRDQEVRRVGTARCQAAAPGADVRNRQQGRVSVGHVRLAARDPGGVPGLRRRCQVGVLGQALGIEHETGRSGQPHLQVLPAQRRCEGELQAHDVPLRRETRHEGFHGGPAALKEGAAEQESRPIAIVGVNGLQVGGQDHDPPQVHCGVHPGIVHRQLDDEGLQQRQAGGQIDEQDLLRQPLHAITERQVADLRLRLRQRLLCAGRRASCQARRGTGNGRGRILAGKGEPGRGLYEKLVALHELSALEAGELEHHLVANVLVPRI
mmetsp:Transcript_77129/g.194790  ORF Transcript_77129/g.194790 Transcript_77129/m.194790 type:complete len:289 (+) Transcript_77129:1049-1915(+)